jgi:hypothetical protein
VKPSLRSREHPWAYAHRSRLRLLAVRLAASVWAATVLVNVAASAPPTAAQLPASNYSPTPLTGPIAPPQPSQIVNPAPSEEVLAPPRILPPPDAPPPGAIPDGGAAAMPPNDASLPPDGVSVPPRLTFRDRWHYFMQSHLWGFPSQFQTPPLGYFMYQHGQTEVANGIATLMVLYHYDFVDGCDKLNLHGRDQLAKIAAMLPKTFFPIVIERTPEAPGLAECRRLAVLNELAHGPFPIPPQRVVIGPSLGDDLRGVEAALVNQNIMMQTMVRGMGVVTGGGMASGMAGMGGGMSPMGGGVGGMGAGMGGMGSGLGAGMATGFGR